MTSQLIRHDGKHVRFGEIVETTVPARLERLRWGRFHTLVIAALGVTWILDGLEVTLVGSLSGALKESPALRFSNTDVGIASSAYLLGAVLGATFFGWLTDRLGRKKLFFTTLTIYMLATMATALSWDMQSFLVFRFLTGAGIGGEYTAVNSTIQELIPARYRGWTDLAINGSFWLGAAIGAAGSILFLDSTIFGADGGWRAAFAIGGALSAIVFVMRLWIPESPRWLITHGRVPEAEAIMADIEKDIGQPPGLSSACHLRATKIKTRSHTPLSDVATTILKSYRQRAFVGLTLMMAQAFFYNAVFFTYALVLTSFYGIKADAVGWYILPFAAGNFLGPVLLGRLFDTWGRRQMLALTYGVSGILLASTGFLFANDVLSVEHLTMAWFAVFFFGSAAASAAYLTVSERSRSKSAPWPLRCFMPSALAAAASSGLFCSDT